MGPLRRYIVDFFPKDRYVPRGLKAEANPFAVDVQDGHNPTMTDSFNW